MYRCTTLSSCGTGTRSAHNDFASDVYVATRACTYTAPDGQLRIHAYMTVATFTDTDSSQLYEVPFISKVYDRYPKYVIYSGSSTGAQSLEDCPFLHGLLPNFIPGKVLKPISIS